MVLAGEHQDAAVATKTHAAEPPLKLGEVLRCVLRTPTLYFLSAAFGAMVFATTSGTQIASVSSYTTSQDPSGITLYTYTATLDATTLPNATYTVVASTSAGSDTVQSNPVTIVITNK